MADEREPIVERVTHHHRETTPLDENGQGDPHVELSFAAVQLVFAFGLARRAV